MQSHTAPINQWIMEQLIMVDALKRASAKRITVIMPFYGYARQDKKHRGREPITARLMADLFKTAGADRLMAVDLHTAQIQGFFDGPVDHLFALPVLADYLGEGRPRQADDRVARRRPGAGRGPLGDRLGAPLAIIHKRRDRTWPTRSRSTRSSVRSGPHLRAGRRHDRHRGHDLRGGRRAVRAGRGRTSSSPPPTVCSPARRSTG